MPTCDKCPAEGRPCYMSPADDKPHEYLCDQHIREGGYCLGCCVFSAGIERFDFSDFCDNCSSQLDDEDDWDDDEYDEDDYY